jgi:hypothetical protein
MAIRPFQRAKVKEHTKGVATEKGAVLSFHTVNLPIAGRQPGAWNCGLENQIQIIIGILRKS